VNTMRPGENLQPSPNLSLPNTVLIAEDDPTFRRVLENWLNSHVPRREPRGARSGNQAGQPGTSLCGAVVIER
jgi:hypothetical protein